MTLVLTVRLEIQTNRILPTVSHKRWSMFAVVKIPRSVLQADTIIVSCGLANFEQSSLSRHRRREFWGSRGELDTGEDHDKFARSFEVNYLGM